MRTPMAILVLTGLATVLAIAWGAAPDEPSGSLTRWEYKHVTVKELLNVESNADLISKAIGDEAEDANKKAMEEINKLGAEGWEMLQVTPNGGFFFKRPMAKFNADR